MSDFSVVENIEIENRAEYGNAISVVTPEAVGNFELEHDLQFESTDGISTAAAGMHALSLN